MDMTTMNSTSSGLMLARDMAMVFFNAHDTPLYSANWAPSSSGAYAGTCIFLVMLAIVQRALVATKSILEARWRDQAWKRRYIVVADKTPFSEKLSGDADSTTGVLTANGVEENVKMIRHQGHGAIPWRFSVDLPRAVFATLISGVGYLL
jgi:copper transporter 1